MCDTIYEASGVSIDWAYGEAGVKYSYTMEMRMSDFGFEVPPRRRTLSRTGWTSWHSTYLWHKILWRKRMRGNKEGTDLEGKK